MTTEEATVDSKIVVLVDLLNAIIDWTLVDGSLKSADHKIPKGLAEQALKQIRPALDELPGLTRISRADLKPKDTLVFEFDGHVSEETAARIEAYMARLWPDHRCAVVGEGGTIKVVSEVS